MYKKAPWLPGTGKKQYATVIFCNYHCYDAKKTIYAVNKNTVPHPTSLNKKMMEQYSTPDDELMDMFQTRLYTYTGLQVTGFGAKTGRWTHSFNLLVGSGLRTMLLAVIAIQIYGKIHHDKAEEVNCNGK